MPGTAGSRFVPTSYQSQIRPHPRSEAKRSRIVEAATRHFAEHGYHDSRIGDIATALGIAKGSIFQHFGSKGGLFFEVYKRAVSSLPHYLDAPTDVRQQGFFAILRFWLMRTENLLHENWVPYRISLLGNYGTDVALKRDINRFLISEDPYGTVNFVRFGLERHELRDDMDTEMIVSMIDWMMERFQDTLLAAEIDPGLFRRQGQVAEKREGRIRQFVDLLQRAIGAVPPKSATTVRLRRKNPRR